MALQDNLPCRDAKQQKLRILANSQQSQHGMMPVNHVLTGFAGNENSPTSVRVTIMPTLIQNQQSIVSSHAHMTNLQVTPAVTSGVQQTVTPMVLHTPKEEQGQREQERRIRREIANSNERRRMQSINAGFKSLKSILPHTEGEKLSKAAILQQTSEYISQLEADKIRLVHQNDKLKRAVTDCNCNPSKHRALADIFEKDEGIGSPAEEDYEDMKRGMAEIKQQLDKERRMRLLLEEQVRNMESQVYPDRIQAGKLSSGDERRSSSECSQSSLKPITSGLPSTKVQPCVRPLLPPLAPLTKLDSKLEGLPPPSVVKNLSSPLIQTPVINIKNPESEGTDVPDGPKVSAATPQTEHSVTVFSHSCNSNQPLKKRAIEIVEVHQNSSSDSGCDSTMLQPKAKIAKISEDQLEKQEMSVMNTSSPDLSNLNRPLMTPLQTVVPGNVPSPVNSTQPALSLPALALSLPEPKAHLPPLSSPSTLQGYPKTVYQTMLPQCSLPADVLMNSPNTAVAMPLMQQRPETLGGATAATVASPAPSNPIPLDVLSIINRKSSQEGGSQTNDAANSIYVAVGGLARQGSGGIAYIQQEGDKLVPLQQTFHHPQYVVAPLHPNGSAVVSGAGLPVSNPSMQVVAQHPAIPHQQLGSPATVITYPAVQVPQPVATKSPALTLQPLQCPNSSTVTQTQSFAYVQSNTHPNGFQTNVPKVQPNPRTVLCYSQPEITLNQLNAVPNFAPPKTLHHPVLSVSIGSSLVQNNGADSPSYIVPSLQETVLPGKDNSYVNPSLLRCRNSSLSATDSCSTASASGAEEEEITAKTHILEDTGTENQSETLLVKRSRSSSITKDQSPTRSALSLSSGVAAYDEVVQEDVSSAERLQPHPSGCTDFSSPTSENTSSIASNITHSPPVMRQIDAIQTRRNLETIVQAIDHLEQQERRNSQDRPEIIN